MQYSFPAAIMSLLYELTYCMKSILSFTHPYLKAHHPLQDGFVLFHVP